MYDLEYILGENFSPADFIKDYWTKSYIHIKGRNDKFNHIFSYQEFSHVLNFSHSLLSSPIFKLVKDGSTIQEIHYMDIQKNTRQGFVRKINIEKVKELCRNGATIIVNGIGKLHLNLNNLEINFSDFFNYSTQINAYYTGIGSQGFGLHYDTHDVIILQVEGNKQWDIYRDITYKFPLSDQPSFGKRRPSGEFDTVIMNKGDVLYIPRGVWHSVKTTNDYSLHLTMDIFTKTGIDLLNWIVDSLKNEDMYRQDVLLGETKINDILISLREKINKLINDNQTVRQEFIYHNIDNLNSKKNKFSFPINS